MAQPHKTPPRTRPSAKRTKRRADAGKTVLHAYAFQGAAGDLLARPLPPGIKVTLVPSDAAAEKKLKDWAPQRVRRMGRIVPGRGFTGVETAAKPRVDVDAFAPDARARALLRGAEIGQADLKAAGGAYDLDQVQALLHGVSRQRVDRRVKEGSLLAVPGPSNRRRYPTVQFTRDGEVVPGLREVQAALPTRNPWAVLNFLIQPDDRLDGRKPIDVLKSGEVDLVVSAARGVGRQGG